MAGAYEREAIRPNVLGRFADLLQAVESHPAMLVYLDNVLSMGADSIAGINQDKGLNENLARETLELHTLGVRSGYSQADVTNFAKVLTGWTWLRPEEPVHGGEFVFVRRFHEPGDQVVLGKHYPDSGFDQGRAVLGGALDGLATVAPVGDPDWLALRGDNALTLDGKLAALKLDEFFALNPAMPNLHRMFEAEEAIIVHACATPYRERSHFDGQDLLESGLPKPGASESGWLNRAMAGLTRSEERRVGKEC